MQADARLVEDIHDVDQATAELFDDLHPLRFAAGEGVGGAGEGEVLQPDVDQVLQPLGQRGDHRGVDGAVDGPDHLDQVGDLHRLQIGDVVAVDAAVERGPVEPRAMTRGTGAFDDVGGDRLLRPLRDVGRVLFDVFAGEFGDDAFEGEVDLSAAELRLYLARRAMEQQVHLLGGVIVELFVGVEQARLHDEAPVPLLHRVAGAEQRPLVERERGVEEALHIDGQLAAEAVAFGAHALRVVEREGVGVADERPPGPREQQPQHGGDVGDGADGRVGAAAHPLLVDDDGHAQISDEVGVGAAEAGQEVAHEHAEVLVQQPLALGGDGVEDD